MRSEAPLLICDLLEQVAPGALSSSKFLTWPPDVFAVCATILRHSDAYERVLSDWPPAPYTTLEEWRADVDAIGSAWAKATTTARANDKPLQVSKRLSPLRRWWRTLGEARQCEVRLVQGKRSLYHALIELLCAADQACQGITSFLRTGAGENLASVLLGHLDGNKGRTLCDRIHPSRAVVLPKTHTPQIGLTLRSLTHHIALLPPAPVDVRWRVFPFLSAQDQLNMLLLPWPLTVPPGAFSPVGKQCGDERLPPEFGFFGFEALDANSTADVVGCVEAAERIIGAGRLNAIVLPELALPVGMARQIAVALAKTADRLVIAGEGTSATRDGHGENAAVIVRAPMDPVRQRKHHRWQVDRSQILQYGLGASLDPERTWWEGTDISSREINIWQLQNGVSFCVLICEDLARQDPVAEIIRSLGPSLVVVLLLDGPQLAARWSSRYATVLADDPGCSVLTLTNLGMASLSVPPGRSPSRVVALWREGAGSGARELALEPGAEGIVLSLSHTAQHVEWTADGRTHTDAAARVSLTGAHSVHRNA